MRFSFHFNRNICLCSILLLTFTLQFANANEKTTRSFRELKQFASAEAHQAVAVDETSFFAISSRSIARYHKVTGKLITKWNPPADSEIQHLNSGAVIDGKLYCAHSNWPSQPTENSIEVFEASTLKHIDSLKFPETKGAINWVDRRQGKWWIVFAFYGNTDSVRKTELVSYDDDWKSQGRWSFPDFVIKQFLPNSNSGGSWGPNGLLYVTGHDQAKVYALRVPQLSGPLVHVDTLPAPVTGQGIAWDRSDIGTLYGIIRSNKQVVKMRITHSIEFNKLREKIQWTRNQHNPILPPRKPGTFDSTRCMNPWVLRVGNQYHLYYAGGNDKGLHRICMATATINDVTDWTRTGPLFDTGTPNSFDVLWCVLPHVIQFPKGQQHLYYTGRSGKGEGLSSFRGIGLARGSDSLTWKRSDEKPVLAPSDEPGSPDAIGIAGVSVIQVKQTDGKSEWRFYYTGCPTVGRPVLLNQQKTICLAVSNDGIHWKKQGAVMLRNPDRDYENIAVAGPVVHQRKDGTFQMWYSAIGTRWGYYSICYAESVDGIHWTRGAKIDDNLQLAPQGTGWESQMVEYPSIIREGNRLRLFYCGNGYGKTGIGTAVSSPIDWED